MAVVPFYSLDREHAIEETRSINIPHGGPLPADSYAFMEFYCNDPQCDCRRVIFQVWRQSTGTKIWATITYGWDTPEYYARWSHGNPVFVPKEMASATLEIMSPQTKWSLRLLKMCKELLLSDPLYVARLQRHYQEMCPGRGPAQPPINPTGNPSAKVLRKMRERRRNRKH